VQCGFVPINIYSVAILMKNRQIKEIPKSYLLKTYSGFFMLLPLLWLRVDANVIYGKSLGMAQ